MPLGTSNFTELELTARVPTGLCLMVSKLVLNHIIRSHMCNWARRNCTCARECGFFWYPLAYLAYMVRASLKRNHN